MAVTIGLINTAVILAASKRIAEATLGKETVSKMQKMRRKKKKWKK